MIDGNGVKLVTRKKTEENEQREEGLEADYGDATAEEVALALLRYRPGRDRPVKRGNDD